MTHQNLESRTSMLSRTGLRAGMLGALLSAAVAYVGCAHNTPAPSRCPDGYSWERSITTSGNEKRYEDGCVRGPPPPCEDKCQADERCEDAKPEWSEYDHKWYSTGDCISTRPTKPILNDTWNQCGGCEIHYECKSYDESIEEGLNRGRLEKRYRCKPDEHEQRRIDEEHREREKKGREELEKMEREKLRCRRASTIYGREDCWPPPR